MLSGVAASRQTQASDRLTFEKHCANLSVNLAHRIHVAKAQRNGSLVALLEQEKRQLEQFWRKPSDALTPTQRLKAFWATLKDSLANQLQLQVEQVSDDAGRLWWYAFDPRSGKTLYAESESDVIQWIEENRIGH
ncbi:MAG TPA: CHRD domain-containing protein [Trichocoleus sp.]